MKHYFLDVETYKKTPEGLEPTLNTQEFTLGLMIDEQNNAFWFEKPQDMYNAIKRLSQRPNTHFWAHNHEYDFYAYTYPQLKKLIQQQEIKVIRPSTLLAFIDKARLIDTLNFFPYSLEELGKNLNFEKKEMPKIIKNKEELKEYLIRDVLIVKKAVETLLETYKEIGYNPRSVLTNSSSSMKYFINTLNKQNKSNYLLRGGKIKKYEATIPFLRQGSKGGRNEIFFTGTYKNATYIDINSSYLEEMTKMPVPDLLKEDYLSPKMCHKTPINQILQKEGIVQARVKVKQNHVGLLATRYGTTAKYKLVFPNIEGQILDGWWTTAELRFAQKNGYEIMHIMEAVLYHSNITPSPLKEHIQHLYNHKENYKAKGEHLKEKIVKGLGTGLYGKFIQKKHEKTYKWIPRVEIDEWLDQGWDIASEQETYCIVKNEKDYVPKYQSIIIGALISAYARIRVTQYLLDIINEGRATPLYCDTDGIIIEGEMPKCIKIGTKLGEFKIEAQGPTIILQQKTYMVGPKIHMAGIPKKLRTESYFTELKPIISQQMQGINQAHKGNWNIIGTFKEKTHTPHYQTPEPLPLFLQEPITK